MNLKKYANRSQEQFIHRTHLAILNPASHMHLSIHAYRQQTPAGAALLREVGVCAMKEYKSTPSHVQGAGFITIGSAADVASWRTRYNNWTTLVLILTLRNRIVTETGVLLPVGSG